MRRLSANYIVVVVSVLISIVYVFAAVSFSYDIYVGGISSFIFLLICLYFLLNFNKVRYDENFLYLKKIRKKEMVISLNDIKSIRKKFQGWYSVSLKNGESYVFLRKYRVFMISMLTKGDKEINDLNLKIKR